MDMALYFPDQHGHECIVQAGILKGLGNELFKGGDLRCSFGCVCARHLAIYKFCCSYDRRDGKKYLLVIDKCLSA